MTNVTKISFPKDFAHKIRKLIEKRRLPYRSVSEFVLDSSRRRVEQIESGELLGRSRTKEVIEIGNSA